jgi:hypothetical protein
VSDWLTKIIVGVGLVQIGRALPALTKLAKSLNEPLGGQPYGGAFGLGLTIFYALLGFLFLYLWSRTDFTRELQQLAGVVQTEVGKVDSAASKALLLVNRQLNGLKGGQPPTQDELNQAVSAAPESTRIQIFDQAEHVRSVNMRTDKDLMALTVPVFYALIAADTDNKYHRTHGSLGWALKDKIPPDWRGARAELTRAIAIRDPGNPEPLRCRAFGLGYGSGNVSPPDASRLASLAKAAGTLPRPDWATVWPGLTRPAPSMSG